MNEKQGADFDASLEDIVKVRNGNGELKRVEVADDAEND